MRKMKALLLITIFFVMVFATTAVNAEHRKGHEPLPRKKKCSIPGDVLEQIAKQLPKGVYDMLLKIACKIGETPTPGK